MQMFCEPADKIDRLTLIHLRLLMQVKNAESEYSKLWIYINLFIFKIFQGAFFNAVLHDVSMRWIIENYPWMDKKVRPVEAINLAKKNKQWGCRMTEKLKQENDEDSI